MIKKYLSGASGVILGLGGSCALVHYACQTYNPIEGYYPSGDKDLQEIKQELISRATIPYEQDRIREQLTFDYPNERFKHKWVDWLYNPVVEKRKVAWFDDEQGKAFWTEVRPDGKVLSEIRECDWGVIHTEGSVRTARVVDGYLVGVSRIVQAL
jgi:hypothetical protein